MKRLIDDKVLWLSLRAVSSNPSYVCRDKRLCPHLKSGESRVSVSTVGFLGVAVPGCLDVHFAICQPLRPSITNRYTWQVLIIACKLIWVSIQEPWLWRVDTADSGEAGGREIWTNLAEMSFQEQNLDGNLQQSSQALDSVFPDGQQRSAAQQG